MVSRLRVSTVIKNVAVFVVYFAAAKYFLDLTAIHSFAAIIWPASGIALAAVVLWGYSVLPGVTAAAFLVNLSVGAAPLTAGAIAIGNTLECFTGAYFLRTFIHLDPLLARMRDALGIIIVGPLAAALSATIGVSALTFSGTISSAAFLEAWVAWWTGDTVSILILAPFLIRWLTRPFFTKTWREVAEGLALFGSLIAVDLVTFFGPLGSQPGSSPLIYLTLLPLIWAALRSGPRGTTLAIYLTSTIAFLGTFSGHGPFVSDGSALSGSLELLQIFKGMMAITFLLFVAAVEERKEALRLTSNYVDKLEQAVYKINSADQAKNDFLAVLAHELRNPLAPVLSAIEILKIEGASTPRKKHQFEVIEKQISNMSRLLEDLLDVSRITRRKFKIQKEIVELSSILKHARETVLPFMEERRHAFIVEGTPKLFLEADPLRIEQIIINLLNNAAKYTEPGGIIKLRTHQEGESVVIEVEDNGMGVEPGMKKKIFDPFFQGARPAGQNAGHGTGLGIGLSLTKRLVELHRGTIEVESEGLGKGSLFRVRLPLAPQSEWPQLLPQPILSFETPESSRVAALTRRILVVDDNVDAARGISSLLQRKGHIVETVYDGESALDTLATFHPEVVVLDIGLPDMDGYEAARRIREAYGDGILLIALTGYGLEEDKLRARMAGFNHHLTKPVGIVELERVLQ